MPKLTPKSIFTKHPPRKGPVWKGPEEDGVTQSLLGRFLSCRERFRVLVVEGLQPTPCFNPRLEFGNMWHVCEEAHASDNIPEGGYSYVYHLTKYCKKLCQQYPLDQEKINHWYSITKSLFPRYVDHWAKHPDVVDRQPLLAEQTFCVPYALPSGRVVKLRGKWDSVDLIGKGKNAGIWLQENKTKSSIDAVKIHRQLKFDLQTMMYLVALGVAQERGAGDESVGVPPEFDQSYIKGVRYNVIRRSAHKSTESMLKKLEDDRADGRIGEWFARWNVEVSAADIARFRRECLDPILEQLCDWWYLLRDGGFKFGAPRNNIHYRHPYGVYNPIDEGGFGDVDAYLESGSRVGLHDVHNLFPELT